ncbi:MAG: hypothetical protein ACFFC9_04205 [Promethearchaeota archaeon]
MSFFRFPTNLNEFNNENIRIPKISASLEGTENIIIIDPDRNVNILKYGFVIFEDTFTVSNENNNPINSIFIGIPLKNSDDLLFFKATGDTQNTLITERSYFVMNDYEMIAIYFDTPLLPQQTRLVHFFHSYQNQVSYEIQATEQVINFTGYLFPIFPYKSIGVVKALFVTEDSTEVEFEKVGEMGVDTGIGVQYDISGDPSINFIEPYLANIDDDHKEITITFQDNQEDPTTQNRIRFTRMDMEGINRDIIISPWGVIKVKEEFLIKNDGVINIEYFFLRVPEDAKNVDVYDELGQLSGATLIQYDDDPNYQQLSIKLTDNRALLTPGSKFRFIVEYYLPFEKYSSTNWFQDSIQMDIFTTKYDYLGKNQVTKIIIEGCNRVSFFSNPPNAIEESQDAKIIVYESNYVIPTENYELQLTFSVDLFNLLLRPLTIMLIISIISAVYIIITKTRRKIEGPTIFKKESIPVNEIREFCYLYEEMNALILEIRKTEEDAKHKKVAKKQLKNIISKNISKIEQIKQEIIPFKQTLNQTSEVFGGIIKKLDVLDAERTSINDSLSLLESRYKRGKLPSKAAYQKLSNDFFNRRKKIDRTIDKYIQQLRSYLL